MLKTNSKKAKENTRKYIIDTFNNYVDGNATLDTLKTNNLSKIAKIIFSDARHYLNLSGIDPGCNEWTTQNDFEKYAAIMPGYVETYCVAWDVLGEILEETEEEKNRFTSSKAETVLTAMVYRELFNAMIRPYDSKNI